MLPIPNGGWNGKRLIAILNQVVSYGAAAKGKKKPFLFHFIIFYAIQYMQI